MEKRIKILEQDKYLVFPIKAKQKKIKIFLSNNSKIITELNIPIGTEERDYSYDYLAYFPIHTDYGREIVIEGEVPEKFMEAIHTANAVTINRKDRPTIHFTPDYGWINDPNGLVYQNGVYHLFFQYNPFDTEWDNMCWGHAVSQDLLHWEQKDTVLFPDEDGVIFSGCGLVNEFGFLGLPKDALLFYYTAAGDSNELSEGKNFIQKLAYSLDFGKTLIKKQTILPAVCQKNRDPKIFWHEPTNAYIMCMWLENNEFAILRSEDLEKWEMSQRLTLDKGFECPDLFELPIQSNQETEESKWVFWCADGFYYVGDFDGYLFQTDGIRREAYITKLPYAAQTISNVGKRVISIPWLRTKTIDIYTGCMGLPREISFAEYGEELRLKLSLIKEIENRQNLIYMNNIKMNQSDQICLFWDREGAVKIDLNMAYEKEYPSKSFWSCILGEEIFYDADTGILKVSEDVVELECDLKDFCIVVDKGIIEITAKHDTIYTVFNVANINDNQEVIIYSKWLKELKIYEVV